MRHPSEPVRILSTVIALASAGGLAAQETVRPPQERIVIRALDKVIRRDGKPIEGIIVTPRPLEQASFDIETSGGKVKITISSSEVESIVPRQSAETAYANWREWLYRNYHRDPRLRARGELALALWCHHPHPALGGEPPNPEAAVRHLENAVRLDPALGEAYPYLVSIYSRRHPLGEGPVPPPPSVRPVSAPDERDGDDLSAQLDAEIETYLLARDAGLGSVGMEFRLGAILALRYGLLDAAVPYLEAVLSHPEANPGQKRRSRALLSEAYLRRGEAGKALGLYERVLEAAGADTAGGTDGGEAPSPESASGLFEAYYRLAAIRTRLGGAENLALARDLFGKAREIQPGFLDLHLDLAALDYAGGDLAGADKLLRAYLAQRPGNGAAIVDRALVQIRLGKLAAAERLLEQAATAGAPAARVHMARGLMAEFRDNLSFALAEYRDAARAEDAGDDGPLADLLVASTLVRQGLEIEARAAIETIRRAHSDDRRVFGACSRLLAAVDVREGRFEDAASHLEYALDTAPSDAPLLERAGIVFLHAGKRQQGVTFLGEAQRIEPERPPSLNGLAYHHYTEGEIDLARELFAASHKKLRTRRGERRLTWRDAQKAYAASALQQIRDLQNLEVLVDDFEGADSAKIDRWDEVEIYGITIDRRDGKAVLQGTQVNSPEGETTMTLMRLIDSRSFDRLTATVRLAMGDAVPILRLETPTGGKYASAGVMVYRDLDGLVKVRFKGSRGGWETPEVTEEEPEEDEENGDEADESETRSQRRLRSRREPPVYRGGVPWPSDDRFHVLEIRASSSSSPRLRRSRAFNVYFDGMEVARNIGVPGIGGTQYQAVIAGRTDALGKVWALEVDSFKVYRSARRRAGTSSRRGERR